MTNTLDLGLEILTDGQEDAGDALNTRASELDKGYTRQLTLGETILEGQVGYLEPTAVKVDKANASAAATAHASGVGLCMADGVLDDNRFFRYFGRHEMSDWTNVIGATLLTAGARYYLDTTSGLMTTTKPTGGNKVVEMGWARTTTIFDINIIEYIESATTLDGIFDAVVDAGGAADYTSIYDAVNTEAAGATIGVRTGNYTESNDIPFKEGQSLIALQGLDNDSGVVVTMGDNILNFQNDKVRVEGIYWKFTPTTNKSFIDINAALVFIEKNTFDFTAGAAVHSGFDITSGGLDCRFRDIEIKNNAASILSILNAGGRNYFNDIRITGGDASAGDIVQCSGDLNFHERLIIQAVNAGSLTYSLLNVTGDSNVCHACNIDGGTLAVKVTRDAGLYNFYTDHRSLNGDGSIGIELAGTGTTIGGFDIRNTATGSGTDGFGIKVTTGNYHNISNGTISNCGTGIDVVAGDYGRINGVTFIAIGGSNSIVIPDGADSWIITRNRLDVDINIAGDFTIIDGNIAGSLGATIAATANATIFGNNHGFQYTVNDSGTGTKFDAIIHFAATAPTATDDDGKFFKIGDFWYDTAANNLYICDDPSTAAAVWTLVGGASSASLYDAIVDAAGGADYTTISAAIAGLAGAGTIGVKGGTDITEIADIVPATGQTIVGMGGVNTNVNVVMADYKITLASKSNVQIEGLRFNFTPVTDEPKIDIDASCDNIQFRKLFLVFSGTAQHSGIRDYGNNSRMIDIRIANQINSTEALAVEGDDCVYERFRIIGGKTTTAKYMVSVTADSLRNTFRRFNIDGLGASTVEVVYVRDLGGTVKDNLFDDWYIDGTNVTGARLWRVEGQYDMYSNIVAENATSGLFWIRNDYNQFSGIITDTVYQPFYFEAGADHNEVVNAHLNNSTNRGILNEGDDNVFVNVTVENTSGVYSYDGAGDGVKISNSQFDALFDGHGRFSMSNCDLNDADFDFGCDNSRMTVCRATGTVAFEDGLDNMQVSACDFADLDIEGADKSMLTSCVITSLAITGGSGTANDNRFSACRIVNVTVADAVDTVFCDCLIDGTLTNGSSAVHTQVIHSRTGTWTPDSGQDTVNDPFYPQSVTSGAANAIRGGRQYDNTGAAGGIGFDLPDPASVQVSVGFRVRFRVVAAQEVKINCVTAQTIHNGVNSTTTGTGDVKSSTQWSTLELEYIGSNEWIAVDRGSWTWT